MVDLVKGGGDKEPNRGKKKKSSSLKGGGKSSGSSEEEQPAQLDSSESGKDSAISFGAAVASAGAAAKSAGAPSGTPSNKSRRSVLDGSGGKKSAGGSLRSPTSLDVKSKYCPYLGGRKERERIVDYPVVSNVCFAEGSREKKLLRTLTLPFTVIPPQRQREFCLATYSRCPVYQSKQKKESG
jgi:hypothetical protein